MVAEYSQLVMDCKRGRRIHFNELEIMKRGDPVLQIGTYENYSSMLGVQPDIGYPVGPQGVILYIHSR